ncbi:uncharacterized protein LOC142576213 [Dermacentor variabilis]|uniref:uncharacterized protein LOC142576213 n=1 Tax=Dermacentor variabilis TaxID=34621 RepID=UPI003F5C0280
MNQHGDYRARDHYQARHRYGASGGAFEETSFRGPPPTRGGRFGGQVDSRADSYSNRPDYYDPTWQYGASRRGRHSTGPPADVHQRQHYGYGGTGGYHNQRYEHGPPHHGYAGAPRGRELHDRGRSPRDAAHPRRGRGGGWSSWLDTAGHRREGNVPLTAGESLLHFKRAVRRMNNDCDRSVLSESCARSVSEVSDARSQYADGDYATHRHAGFTTRHGNDGENAASSASRERKDLVDRTEAVIKRRVPLQRDVSFEPCRPVAAGASLLTSMISVFWDIENCAVPNGVPAYEIVLKVRQRFYAGYREADFVVACDTARMSPAVIAELNEALVTVIHVPGDQKNAADEKLRTVLRRFSDAHKLTGSRIVLISGDVDFAAEIHEMRYTDHIDVVLIHNEQAKRALRDAANESISYSAFLADLKSSYGSKAAKMFSSGHRNEGKDKESKNDLKKSVSSVGARVQEDKSIEKMTKIKNQATETGAQPSFRTTVGLLVPREPTNAVYWKEYLSHLNVPQDFTLEVACGGKDIVCLVYPSATKARKAVEALNDPLVDDEDVPVCLGIISKDTTQEVDKLTPEQPSRASKVKSAITNHKAKLEAVSKRIRSLKGDEKTAPMLQAAYEYQATIYEAQLTHFLKIISDLPQSPQQADDATATEIARLKRGSVVYSVKSTILETLSGRQVVFLMSSPGSKTALEVASYAQDLNFRVLSVQSSDFTAEQCSKDAGSVSGLGPVQCWLSTTEKVNSENAVVFTSARHFFQEILRRDMELSDFQAIIVDELQEDTAYQRAVLTIIRKYFVSKVGVVLCGNHSVACRRIQEAFCLETENIIRCVLAFPVDVIWKGKPTNRVMACVCTALEFCQTAEAPAGGDVLVFLPSLTDAFLADGFLGQRIREEKFDVAVAHEVLSSSWTKFPLKNDPLRKGCWRVIFAVECPDAVMSALRVRCVVDSGLTLKAVYRSGIFVMQLAYVTETEAEERRTLAGIHGCGTCYRLYSKAALVPSSPAELHSSKYLEDIVLRLFAQQKTSDALFVNELPKTLLDEVKTALKQIGALDAEGQATDLGARLCQTSLQPRLGMLVLCSMGKAPSLDSILLSLLVFEDLLVAYRPLKEGGNQRDFPVSDGSSVFSGVIQLYKNWLVVPKKMKSSWCDVHDVNENFMNYLHNAVRSIQQEFTEFKGRNLAADSAKEEKNATITLGELLAQSFPQGLLQADQHGYKHPTLGDHLQVSPLSLFDTEAIEPKNVVCCLFAQVHGDNTVKLLNFAALPVSFCKREPTGEVYRAEETNQELVERFGPVGKLIWNHQFNSTSALQVIEEKLRIATDGSKGHLERDAARQCVVIRGQEKYCFEALRCLQSIVSEQVTKLSRKDREAFLTPARSPYEERPVLAVLGIGGHVNELLAPAAFRTILAYDVRMTHTEFCRRVNELGEIVLYRYMKQDSTFEITYKTAPEADNAYRALSEQGGDLKVTVKGDSLEYRQEQRERRPAFRAQISLPRRLCSGTAFAQLPDQASHDRVAARLPVRVRLDNNTVTIHRDKKVSCQLYITGLPSTVSQSALEGLIRSSLSVDVKKVSLVREAARKTPVEKLRALGDAVQKLFDEELRERSPKLVLNTPRMEDYIERGWLSFEDPNAAQGACTLLRGSPVPVDRKGEDGIATLPMAIHILVEGTLYFPCSFFEAIQGQIEEELRRQDGLRPEDNIKCDATPCGESAVRVKLKANNLNDFHKAVHLFNRMILGPDAPRVDSRVRPERVVEVLKAMAPDGGIYVYRKPGETRLVGEAQLVAAASEMLKRHTKAWEKRQRKRLALVGEGFTVLKSFITTFGDDPWYLARECKLDAATFDGQFETVEILGTDAAIREAERLVGQLPKSRVDEKSTADAGQRCPICRLPPGDAQKDRLSGSGHRLELCGHWHCESCLLLVFKRAPLPLTCFEKDCDSPWAIADITHVTGNNQDLLSDLARRSFECSVAADLDGRWLPCPTPECHFALDSKMDAEAQGVHVLGNVHVCPGCTNAVCFRCRSLYHYGISCATFKDSMSPNGANDKSWLNEDPGKRALCPSCRARLERNTSNKVDACWSCRRLFCWRCHRSFEDDATAARGHRTQYCQMAPLSDDDTCCVM